MFDKVSMNFGTKAVYSVGFGVIFSIRRVIFGPRAQGRP